MPVLESQKSSAVAVKNILFATDFSEASEAALPYVAALSARYGSKIHLTHVLPEATFLRPGAPSPAVIGSIYEDAHSNAQEKIQKLAKRLKGDRHCSYLRHGEIASVVSALVKEQEIDLVVAGTHGRTGLGRLIMGSVAEEILRQTACPVLTVGPNVVGAALRKAMRQERDMPPPQIEIRDILYATDFRQQSTVAVELAMSIAMKFQAQLGLLHVLEDYGDHLHEHPGPLDIALRKLGKLIPDGADLQKPPETLAQYGIPAECILQTAAQRETDILVLGARPIEGNVKLATHLGAAVAHRIIVGANCPVLTVRA